MAKQNVTDESGPSSGADTTDSGFVKGYQASTPASAMSPDRPSWEPYRAPGENAVAMKKQWKGKPSFLPNGEGDDATF